MHLSIKSRVEQWKEEDEHFLRTLKLPSLRHGHSVKGPGLVAMATLVSFLPQWPMIPGLARQAL